MPSVARIALAYNNVYLVDDGQDLVAIDTGPDYRGSREAISAALAGRRPSLVVATHGHLDHAGLGAWWQSQGIPVALGAADLPQATGETDADIDLLEEYVRTGGAPAEVQVDVTEGLESRRRYMKALRQSRAYAESGGGRWPTGLRYPTFKPERLLDAETALPCGLTALHSPGHTPGNLVVVHGNEGWLFSGDQLLPEITPTPAVQFSEGRRFPSLPRFLESLETLAQRPPSRCLPGHGEPFEDVRQVMAENLGQARQRSERLHEAMTTTPETVYHLAERLYPRALRRRFWQIISTIQGHLDVLGEAGHVVEDERHLWRRA